MENIDNIFCQFKQYIKMRNDIKSKMHAYETNEVKKIKGFFLIDKEWLKNWKNSINYFFLKLIKEEEKIKAYIKENFSKKKIERDEIKYIVNYKTIIEENKRYKLVTKDFLNCFLNEEKKIKTEENNDCLSCYFGNDKIIIDFEENKKLICKAKMQGDLFYIILHNYEDEEKNDIIVNVLKLVSYKFIKVLGEVPILKGKYKILRWDQVIRQDDFFYDDLFNDYDPMEYYDDIKYVDQNSIPEKILEIYFLYYAINLKINRDINKKMNINEGDSELFFTDIKWIEELKKMFDYEEVIKIIPNKDITYEFLSRNYDIYVHGARYQKIYSKKYADIKKFKETFDFSPSFRNLKKVDNCFLFINYMDNFAIINWKAYCFIRQFFDYKHEEYDYKANCALTNGKLFIAFDPSYVLITSQSKKNENFFKTEFIIYYNGWNYYDETISKTVVEDFIHNLENMKDKMVYFFNRNEWNKKKNNILIKLKKEEEKADEESLSRLSNRKKITNKIEIESISSIKEFPFMQLSIKYQINNPYFTPLNIILHSLLQIDLLVNYFFKPEIKKLFESKEELPNNNIYTEKDFILTKQFQKLLNDYWCPTDESLLLINTTNIINSFTLLSLAQKEIEKEDLKKMPQKIIITFIKFLHQELNKLNKKKELEKDKKNEIFNPFDKSIVFNNFIEEFKKNYHSIISDHFFGVYEKTYECLKCKELEKKGIIHPQKIFKYEIYNHLEFNIEEIALYKIQRNQNCFIKNININDCFYSINISSNLISNSNEDLIYCKNCNMKVNPLISNFIFSLPRILIITLDYGKMNIENNKFSLKYEEKIIVQNNNYSLLSIFGKFKETNYLANKNPIDNKWYFYDKLKYIENIEEEVINNPLFKPLFLIYKILNENISTNNNPIFSFKEMNNQIDIYFICTESQIKYKLNVSTNLQFIKVIHKLFNTYPELENKNIATYVCNAEKINLFGTVLENNINNDSLILMIYKDK